MELNEDEFTVKATNEQLSLIYKLATEQIRLENELEEAEQKVAGIKKELLKVQQGFLPVAIQEAGLSEVKTASGDSITIKEDLAVSVPKTKMASVVKWLEDNNYGDVVFRKIAVELPKHNDNERKAAIEALVGAGFEPTEETTISTATLKAILRDCLKQGQKIKLEDFGGFAWRKAIIKRP